MLGFGRRLMLLPEEEFGDVPIHRETACPVPMLFGVVPLKVDPSKFFPFPIF